MPDINFDRFKNLGYDSFRALAQDETLSRHEKVGFPDSYREGKGEVILADILQKLTNLHQEKQVVVDIGAGCSDVPLLMIELCREHGHTYIPIDSQEMLDLLPDDSFIIKTPGYFPDECTALLDEYRGRVDVVLMYGVIQVVFMEGNIYRFMDQSLSLLADGGQLLVGDMANISKRKRFFSSRNGISFHQNFMETTDAPHVEFNVPEPAYMDDAVIISLLMRARAAGFDAYLVPQNADLPMANRREDLLFYKP